MQVGGGESDTVVVLNHLLRLERKIDEVVSMYVQNSCLKAVAITEQLKKKFKESFVSLIVPLLWSSQEEIRQSFLAFFRAQNEHPEYAFLEQHWVTTALSECKNHHRKIKERLTFEVSRWFLEDHLKLKYKANKEYRAELLKQYEEFGPCQMGDLRLDLPVNPQCSEILAKAREEFFRRKVESWPLYLKVHSDRKTTEEKQLYIRRYCIIVDAILIHFLHHQKLNVSKKHPKIGEIFQVLSQRCTDAQGRAQHTQTPQTHLYPGGFADASNSNNSNATPPTASASGFNIPPPNVLLEQIQRIPPAEEAQQPPQLPFMQSILDAHTNQVHGGNSPSLPSSEKSQVLASNQPSNQSAPSSKESTEVDPGSLPSVPSPGKPLSSVQPMYSSFGVAPSSYSVHPQQTQNTGKSPQPGQALGTRTSPDGDSIPQKRRKV